jgi:hypothetical protein
MTKIFEDTYCHENMIKNLQRKESIYANKLLDPDMIKKQDILPRASYVKLPVLSKDEAGVKFLMSQLRNSAKYILYQLEENASQ